MLAVSVTGARAPFESIDMNVLILKVGSAGDVVRTTALLRRLEGDVTWISAAHNTALLERPGTALSKAQLEERLYSWGEEVESNAVEVHVHNLRRKLGADAIRTIRGVGYVIARA